MSRFVIFLLYLYKFVVFSDQLSSPELAPVLWVNPGRQLSSFGLPSQDGGENLKNRSEKTEIKRKEKTKKNQKTKTNKNKTKKTLRNKGKQKQFLTSNRPIP